jgi:hypothetical protein
VIARRVAQMKWNFVQGNTRAMETDFVRAATGFDEPGTE